MPARELKGALAKDSSLISLWGCMETQPGQSYDQGAGSRREIPTVTEVGFTEESQEEFVFKAYFKVYQKFF